MKTINFPHTSDRSISILHSNRLRKRWVYTLRLLASTGLFPLFWAITVIATTVIPPRIDDFSPKTGGMGDIITIVGAGFGQNPNNICAVIMNDDLSIPLQVLSSSPTQIRAMLGPVAPNAKPGPIMLALGTGHVGFFKPLFPDLTLRDPSWVWVRTPNGPTAMSQNPFTPIPTPSPVGPGQGIRWFFSGPPSNGVICLYLNGNWPSPSKVRVQARAHDHDKGIGRDLEAYSIEFPGGGTLLDCAQRICDTIRCAFMQQGMVAVNCKVEQIPGTTQVKLTLSMPDGHISWGNLNVCVEPAPPPPVPVITEFSPKEGPEGTVITIRGQHFGNNPDNICAVMMMPDNRSLPLRVLTGNDEQLTVEVGPVAQDAQPGPIMVGLGDGNVGVFRPAFDDIRILQPVWAWRKTGPAAATIESFRPLPTRPPPSRQWFFSGPPTSDGKLCLFIDQPWPSPARVRIEARAHDHQRNIGRDLRALCIEIGASTITSSAGTIIDPPTALKCAYRICDVIVCAFRQQAGIDVNCTVEEVSPGVVKITLSFPDGQINWGNLNVCMEPVPPPTQPVITGIQPTQGGPGDVITIRGTGFGNNPDNVCAVVMNGNASIPLQVIHATDTEVRAVLGEVPAGAEPGLIMIGLGQGAFDRFRPSFFDVFVADDVWTWNRTGPAAMANILFRPIPRPAPAGTRWYFSGPPVNGVLCITLFNGDFIQPGDIWPQCSNVRIEARAHNHTLGIGHDLHAINLHFEGGGDIIGCGQRIADAITGAFFQQAGIVVNCNVVFTTGSNTVIKVVLSLPEGDIDWGNLNVCVSKCRVVAPPIITNVTPLQGGEGDVITIEGRNFGLSPDNICAIVMSGDESIPLQVLDATDTRIRARVGAVSPGAHAGAIMVGLGEGQQGTFTPQLRNIDVCEPVWVWNRNGGPAGTGPVFRPIPSQPTGSNVWFFSGPATNGTLMTVLVNNWPDDSIVRIEARAHDHRLGIGHDLRAICIRFPNGGNVLQCASNICDVIRSAFRQQAGIDVDCKIEGIPSGLPRAKITLSLPNGRIDWGNLNVCLSAAPNDPVPVITSVSPLQAAQGTLVTVRGTNFPTDPNDICMVHMGPAGSPTAMMSTPFEVLTSSSTQIVARLGPVDPTAQPGPIMIGVGDGTVGTPKFAFFDVFAELPVWTWNRHGPAGQTPPNLVFQPIPAPNPQPPACPPWYFSGPPKDGRLCLFLRTDCPWPRPANIRIEARAHDHQRRIGHDLRAISIRFEGGQSTLDCAYRICDVLRCAFLQQGGFVVNCAVNLVPSSSGPPLVKLTLSLPDGHIDWGNFNVCVQPVTPPDDPVISSVVPLAGQEGDRVVIRGRNFPTDPDNVCAVVMSGNESVPMQVLMASETELIAVLGAVNPEARPGPIMVGAGDGQIGTFTPAFVDIIQEEPTWTWVRNGGAGMGQQTFTPLPTQPPPNRTWFFSGPPNPNTGELCLFLRGDWPPGAKIRIEARAHDHDKGIGRDLRSICIRLPAGGSLIECAKRICDVIRCAFAQQAQIIVNCTVTEIVGPTGNPEYKLTLSLPDGRISWGNLNVCVEAPQPTTIPIAIANFTPTAGGEGDIITIIGTGFGNNPDNLCAVIMNGNGSIPLRVLTAEETQLKAQLGAVMPGAEPGMIMVARGQGNTGRFRPAFFDVFVADDVWTWNRNGGPGAMSANAFRPIPRPPPPYTKWFFGERPRDGVICLFLHGNWPDPAQVQIEARLHDHDTGIGHDLQAINVQWGSFVTGGGTGGVLRVVGMDLLGCAQRICDVIACAFWQQAHIAVNCEIIPVDQDTVKLVLGLPNGRVSWGNFNVCVRPINGDPGSVIRVARVGTVLDQPSILLAWPRSQTGYEVQIATELIPPIAWERNQAALHGGDTELQLLLPAVQKAQYFRLYRLPPILDNPD